MPHSGIWHSTDNTPAPPSSHLASRTKLEPSHSTSLPQDVPPRVGHGPMGQAQNLGNIILWDKQLFNMLLPPLSNTVQQPISHRKMRVFNFTHPFHHHGIVLGLCQVWVVPLGCGKASRVLASNSSGRGNSENTSADETSSSTDAFSSWPLASPQEDLSLPLLMILAQSFPVDQGQPKPG